MTDKTNQKRLLRERGICVVIPTFNNGPAVAGVIRRVLQECDDVIVVDDGSTDGTAAQLAHLTAARQEQDEQPRHGITIVTHDRNRGKGRALQTAFAKARQMGFAYAITIDADGQHYPEDIHLFLEANRRHPHAIVIGSRRMEGKEQSPGSAFANKFSNFWFCVQTGHRLADTQTGYRLYPLNALPPLTTARYEAELWMLVYAAWHGTKLIPVSIDVYYPPPQQRVSHFRPMADFARISALNSVLCILAGAYALPLGIGRWLAKTMRTAAALLFFVTFTVMVFTPAVWLYVNAGPMTERKKHRLHRLLQWTAQTVTTRIGIPGAPFSVSTTPDTDANDQATVSKTLDTPHVIICNHQSHLDLMCLMALSPRMVFLTNDWVWNNPFYGYIIRQADYYPVSKGIGTLMPQLRILVEKGYSIAVFPEGTRSEDCRIGRFHQGAFHIARQLGIGILPTCLYGPGKVLPKKAHTLHKCPIRIEVAAPITRQQLDAMGDTMQQARTLRRHYKEWYDDLCNRMERGKETK